MAGLVPISRQATKHFSLLYRDGNASLAPVYDTLSTAVYPNLTPRMAMNIGGARDFNDVNAASFDAFAVKSDINPKFVRDRPTILPYSDALRN